MKTILTVLRLLSVRFLRTFDNSVTNLSGHLLAFFAGIRKGDRYECLESLVNIFEESGWLLCIVLMFACLIAGFFKPHCFAPGLIFLLLSWMIRVNIEERRRDDDDLVI